MPQDDGCMCDSAGQRHTLQQHVWQHQPLLQQLSVLPTELLCAGAVLELVWLCAPALCPVALGKGGLWRWALPGAAGLWHQEWVEWLWKLLEALLEVASGLSGLAILGRICKKHPGFSRRSRGSELSQAQCRYKL